MIYDVIVIGQGPAGVSAALYLQRANRKTLLVGSGVGSLAKAEKIENYYGLPGAITGEELHNNGIAGAKALGATFEEDEILALSVEEDTFIATGKKGTYRGSSVLLATGAARVAPPIPGLKMLEGRGVSYCAVCDGFFYRGKDVGVLGAGDYALHEALELLPLAKSVTLLTNGAPAPAALPSGLLVNANKVEKLTGTSALAAVEFTGGETLPLAGVL